MVQGHECRLATFVGIQRDVVLAGPIGREETDHRPRRQPVFRENPVQHGLSVGEQMAGVFALFGIIKNSRVAPTQLPGMEERRPVDPLHQFRQRVVVESTDAEKTRFGWSIGRPVERWAIGADLGQRQQRFPSTSIGVLLAF